MEEENFSKIFQNLSVKEEGFENTNFEKCEFTNCKFLGTNFHNTKFIDCIFKNCEMSMVKFDRESKFQDVEFNSSKIVGAMFSKLTGITTSFNFNECHIVHCDFSDMKLNSQKFLGCMIEGCDFINTELKNSNFSKSQFKDSTIQGCNLIEANFKHATGFLINPSENKLFKAVFTHEGLPGLLYPFGIKVE